MYCPNCGCTNDENALVCDNCGANLESNIPPKPLPNKKKTIIVLTIVLLIVSVISAGTIGIVLHKKTVDKNNSVYSGFEETESNPIISSETVDTTDEPINENTTNSSTKKNTSSVNKKEVETNKNNIATVTKNTQGTTKSKAEKHTTKKVSTTANKKAHTEYRYRDKVFTTSSSSKMSGWELYDTTYSWSDYSSWSNWSTSSFSSSNSRQTESRTTYRFYVFRCTKCGNRDPYRTPCDNCKTSQYFKWEELWYPTKGNSMSKGTLSTVPDKYYVTINGARWWFEKDGYSDGQGGKGQPSRKEYRYRDRRQVATYHFYKWSNWSDWSTTPVTSSDNREVETRKVN